MISLRGPEFLPTTCSQVAQQFVGHLVLPPSLGATKYLHVDMLIHGRFYKILGPQAAHSENKSITIIVLVFLTHA